MKADRNTVARLVTIRDVLQVFNIDCKDEYIRCPIHHGDGLNFKITDKYYYCHSKCGSGSIFDLVMHLLTCNFVEAVDWLCETFNIDNGGTAPCEYDKLRYDLLRCTRELEAIETEGKAAVSHNQIRDMLGWYDVELIDVDEIRARYLLKLYQLDGLKEVLYISDIKERI